MKANIKTRKVTNTISTISATFDAEELGYISEMAEIVNHLSRDEVHKILKFGMSPDAEILKEYAKNIKNDIEELFKKHKDISECLEE